MLSQFGNGFVDKGGGLFSMQVLGHQYTSSGDGDFNRHIANFFDGRSLSPGDLVLGHGFATRNRFFQCDFTGSRMG